MQTPPGSAMPSRRAAILTPSPKISLSSMMMSPTWMPMRNSIRCSGGTAVFCSAMPRWISTAQRAASTALANSTSMPSPVVLTMRPRCAAIPGSTSVFRNALQLRERALLVATHQPAVAGDIRRQDRRQSPFHALARPKSSPNRQTPAQSKHRRRLSPPDNVKRVDLPPRQCATFRLSRCRTS